LSIYYIESVNKSTSSPQPEFLFILYPVTSTSPLFTSKEEERDEDDDHELDE